MWTLKKTIRFEAAHRLPQNTGKCHRLHGHSWVAHIILEGSELIPAGTSADMLMDFGDVKAAVQPLLDSKLDHYFLNDTLPLENPTSEAIARWMFEQLKPLLPLLAAVTVEETCTCACEYRP